jgi:hypothetical protein
MRTKPNAGPRRPEQSLNQPPADQPWVWQSRTLRESVAWRSAGINARRFIDFLLLEHMKHGGRDNGRLKAPHRQLEEFGIGARYITEAKREAEELGLVDGYHRGLRMASTYALTWLPLHDGTPATNRWQTFHNPDLKPLPGPKFKGLPSKGKARLPPKGKAGDSNLQVKGKADAEICLLKGRQNLPSHGKAHSISSYQGEDVCSVLEDVCSVLEGRGAELPGGCEEPGEAATGYSHGKPYPSDAPISTKRRVVL